MTSHNPYSLPVMAKAIEVADQGIYYAVNRKTGEINNLFHLNYEMDMPNTADQSASLTTGQWYLYQLKNTNKAGDVGWVILADQGDYALNVVKTDMVNHYFAKPEYAEPKGAWQVIRNSRYGFGKFTPQNPDEAVRYAMILFSGHEMLVPLLILKADIAPEDLLAKGN